MDLVVRRLVEATMLGQCIDGLRPRRAISLKSHRLVLFCNGGFQSAEKTIGEIPECRRHEACEVSGVVEIGVRKICSEPTALRIHVALFATD